jgi:hypothetical protein
LRKDPNVALKVGSRLRAQNSACEVVVIKGPDTDVPLLCGGLAMSDAPGGGTPQLADGPAVELGKRYTDGTGELEVLCVKPGIGPLAYGAEELVLKSAKALPASD